MIEAYRLLLGIKITTWLALSLYVHCRAKQKISFTLERSCRFIYTSTTRAVARVGPGGGAAP